jgi:5'-methylthioadenosine phosphorylase
MVDVTEGTVGAVEVVHLSRHGQGHQRLSHQVDHRANLAALVEPKVDALLSFNDDEHRQKAAASGADVVCAI